MTLIKITITVKETGMDKKLNGKYSYNKVTTVYLNKMIEAALDPKLLNTLKGHKDQISGIHFHPQGYFTNN